MRHRNRYPRTRRAAYQEGELVESIEALRPQDLLDDEGLVRSYGDEVESYGGGPGRAFGRVYEILKLADQASREEMEEAEAAMEHLSKRLDAYIAAVSPYYEESGETWIRFGVMDTDDGIYIVVDEGGYDV